MKYVLLCLWLFCLTAISLLALVPDLMTMNKGADKMLHLCVFCILTIWPMMTFEKRSMMFVIPVGLLALGVAIELTQDLIPSRSSEFRDIVYNTMGVMAGTMIGFLLRESYQSLLPIARAHTHNKQNVKMF